MNKSKETEKIIQEGLIALKNNKNQKALELFTKVIQIDPKDTMAWNNKGVSLRKLGRIDEAIECYNEALKIDPNLTMALLNKARALKVQKKFDMALFTYEDILEIQPQHPLAIEESERVRNLLSRRAHYKSEGIEKDRKEKEELNNLEERKAELREFFEESQKSIGDSVERIVEMFSTGSDEEKLQNRDKILSAVISFNDQLQDRIERISGEFSTLDFEEECRESLDNWETFKEQKIEELKKLG